MDFMGDKWSYTILGRGRSLEGKCRPGISPAMKTAELNLDKRLRINKTPKRDRKALPDEAELSVYIVASGGDPLQVARKYVEDKEKARIKAAGDPANPFTHTFEELTGAEQGDPIPQSVPADTPAVRLKSAVTESPSSNRLFVVSGLKVGDKIVVVQCWCEYLKRDVFETRFVQIAKSLR